MRKLIAGPGVHICDECISLCNDILAEEFAEEFGKGASKAGTPQPTARWVTTSPFLHCILCGIPKEPKEVILIPDRGPLCIVCLDVIRAAAESTEKSNSVHPSTVICPLTTNIQPKAHLLRVHLKVGEAGLKQDSDIMVDQIRAIDKRRFVGHMGKLSRRNQERSAERIRILLA